VREGALGRLLLTGLCAFCFLLFAGLGIWQVDRLRWKLDLIDRVEARLAAPPEVIGRPPALASLPPRDLEYRKVRVTGTFDHERETLVEALTERGAGFWVMTPLRTAGGPVLVNRGFVPKERRAPASRTDGQIEGPVSVTGLIRLDEPEGRFLRANRPAEERWYSRDVTAIAAARGIDDAAPFFIDADATANPGGYPIGGLTVVSFRNTHLIYALTWFALAALSLWGGVLTYRTSATRG
jgi:surfeit locus 1 family protein